MNDTTTQNGTHNGSVKKTSATVSSPPPEIPHITNNIIPLSNVLKFYTQEAYKQLTTIIENLSTTKESESDSMRKKNFLKVITSLRQDFIKIYTLVKWSSNSKDVGKFIDLLNWFRMQEFYFEQLSFQLNALNSFSGAKLPNSDLITSLEILTKGRPQLPSYNFIKVPKISPEKTLGVLEDLNLILMTRMALMDIPSRFLSSYVIKDGRIIISIPDEFQISITVANDLIIETEEEYYKSPFYFVDFKFLFGINPENSLITYKDNRITTKLPKVSHEKLEKIVNSTLLNQGLSGLYDLLHKYSISFKIYLISRQLKDLAVNSKWRGNIQFNYQNGKSLVIINYWTSHFLSRGWRSFIEIGIDRSYNLNFRWFKNGHYIFNHGITDIFESKTDNENENNESEDLSIDLILNIIVNKHSAFLITKIYDQFLAKLVASQDTVSSEVAQSDQISYISPHQLLIKISPNKSTIFSINPTTGFFYFIDPTPIQLQITKKINSIPSNAKASNFVSEKDMISNVVESLVQLRLETYTKDINSRLMTIEWINNDIIKLNDYESTKLFNFLINQQSYLNASKIQFYRRKNWPSSWFLINLTNGVISKTHWWVSRIKSVNGDWKIQWIQKLSFKDQNTSTDEVVPEKLNFGFFSSLSKLCSNMIIDHMILEELQARGVRFLKSDKIEQILSKFNIEKENGVKEEIKSTSEGSDTPSSPITYESMLMLYNNNDLLPVYNSSTSLFLKIKLININQQTQMELKLFGNFRNLSIKNSEESAIKIDEAKKCFEINDIINLTSRMGAQHASSTFEDLDSVAESEASKNLLDKVFNNLNKLNELIKILDQLHKSNVHVVTNTINDIVIRIKDNADDLTIKLPEMSNEPIRLVGTETDDSIDTFPPSPSYNELKVVLLYLNRYLRKHYVGTKKHEKREKSASPEPETIDSRPGPIIGIIKYLEEMSPILKSIVTIREQFEAPENNLRFPNGLRKVNFDVKLPSLNQIQYIYHFNYTNPASSKKVFKDKIAINLVFKRNKFDSKGRNLIKISLKDNLNSKNLKYKGLFELIFKAINEIDVECQSMNKQTQVQTPSSTSSESNGSTKSVPALMKLNYDFVVNSELVYDVMVKISNCFHTYLRMEGKEKH